MKKIIEKIRKIIDNVPGKVMSEVLAFTICLSLVAIIDLLPNNDPYGHPNKAIDISTMASAWCGFLVMLSCREPSIKKFYLGMAAASATCMAIAFVYVMVAEAPDASRRWLAQTINANLGLCLLALIFSGAEAYRENKEDKPNKPNKPGKPKFPKWPKRGGTKG